MLKLLPREIKSIVLSFLDLSTVALVKRLSKDWNKVAGEEIENRRRAIVSLLNKHFEDFRIQEEKSYAAIKEFILKKSQMPSVNADDWLLQSKRSKRFTHDLQQLTNPDLSHILSKLNLISRKSCCYQRKTGH